MRCCSILFVVSVLLVLEFLLMFRWILGFSIVPDLRILIISIRKWDITPIYIYNFSLCSVTILFSGYVVFSSYFLITLKFLSDLEYRNAPTISCTFRAGGFVVFINLLPCGKICSLYNSILIINAWQSNVYIVFIFWLNKNFFIYFAPFLSCFV